ncbi:hypothetical protein [Altericista sp. CCNU0014]|uniref:hypothetical protein n=1 Tax=Altericista sp. CCNU0014 TaxID=3082949 RepID=UPI00384A5F7D
MANPIPLMSGLIVTVGLVGAALTPFSAVSAAPSTPNSSAKTAYKYSPTLISRYTTGCSEKLRAKGKSAAQAQQMCQCSMKNMQAQHTQGQAIGILMKAQFSGSTDPSTGLPTALTKYFESCRAATL